jgi:hypothetical protein
MCRFYSVISICLNDLVALLRKVRCCYLLYCRQRLEAHMRHLKGDDLNPAMTVYVFSRSVNLFLRRLFSYWLTN